MDPSFVSFHIIGDSFVDLFCFLDGSLPELGGDSRLSLPVSTMAGGSGTNSATHLMSLLQMAPAISSTSINSYGSKSVASQSQVHLHSAVNPNDDYGKIMLAHSEKHGYTFWNCIQDLSTTSTIVQTTSPSATGHCIVIVSDGDRTFMTHTGCMQDFEASHVNYNLNIISDGCAKHIHLHVAGFYNMNGFWNGKLKEKIDLVRTERKRLYPDSMVCVSLVPQHDATNTWDGGLGNLMSLLDFVFMNEVEATHITRGTSVEHWINYFEVHCGNTWIIVTRGKDGSIAIRNGAIRATQAALVVDPIDTTGAGDAFISGFLYGTWEWMKGNPSNGEDPWPVEGIRQGLVWGCSVATCSVLTRGASVPSSPLEIQSFVARTEKL